MANPTPFRVWHPTAGFDEMGMDAVSAVDFFGKRVGPTEYSAKAWITVDVSTVAWVVLGLEIPPTITVTSQTAPPDAKILGAMNEKEIHFRRLTSPVGGMLRNLLSANSHASRIAKSIQQIKVKFREPLVVGELTIQQFNHFAIQGLE